MGAKRGTEHHLAKLNPELVRKIRRLRSEGNSYLRIVEAIDWVVTETTVKSVCTYKNWKHVEDEET